MEIRLQRIHSIVVIAMPGYVADARINISEGH